MTACRCANHSRTEPGYVSCPIDHAAVEQRNEAMRAALLASPKFREEAFAHQGTDAVSAAQDADAAWLALMQTAGAYLEWLVARAIKKSGWAESADLVENGVLTKECADYELSLDPTGSGATGRGAAGGCASIPEAA